MASLGNKASGSNFLDEVRQNTVLAPFPKEVGLDKSRRAEGFAEYVDAVFVGPLPGVVRVRVVRQSASVRDTWNLEG
jgi:hypothetical protein